MNVDLQTIAVAARQNEEEAIRLIAGLSTAQANWHPNESQWSIWQCLDHLARVNLAYAPALQEAVTGCPRRFRAAADRISPGWFGRWFIRQMEPPVRAKFKSPAKGIPKTEGDLRDAMDRYLASHKALATILESSSSVDLNRLRFKNPFISALRFTVGTGLLIVNAHDRRHLWQANRVRETAGFPAH